MVCVAFISLVKTGSTVSDIKIAPSKIISAFKAKCRKQAAQPYACRTKVFNVINFYLGVNFAAFFQYAAAFVGRNGVAATAEAYRTPAATLLKQG